MTLVLTNSEISELVSMRECIEVLEETFLELAHGRAATRRRSDICTPSGHPSGGVYGLKSMDGVAPKLGMGAIRINSEIRIYPEISGYRRIVKVPAADQRYTGLILLFSTATGEPLAIFPDGCIQPMRVAATSALGAKYLARDGASKVAILGSGWQARSQVRAIVEVRPVRQIRCYSTRKEMREAFAKEMSPQVGIDIEPVSSTKEAVADADVVLAATNAFVPVLGPEHVERGVHLSTITIGEFGRDVVSKADVLATLVEDTEPEVITTQGVLLPDGGGRLEGRLSSWAKTPLITLLDLLMDRGTRVAGQKKIEGRTLPDQITCFVNLVGLGVQFAAVGAVVYRNAKKADRGRELPTECFTQLEIP
jgi:ornithine cyclodeaminase/alanine dehydrogenase-like protein (mu-crystallin family)